MQGLRVWNATKREYESKDPHLEGAPSGKDAEQLWEDMMKHIREGYGNDYIDEMLEPGEIRKGDE